MKPEILIILILLFLPGFLFSITIEKAVSNAKAFNPDIKVLENQLAIEKMILKTAEMSVYPALQFKLENSEYQNYQEGKKTPYYNCEISLDLPLWNGNREFMEIKYQKTLILKLEWDLFLKNREIEYQTRLLFYNTLLYTEILNLMYAT